MQLNENALRYFNQEGLWTTELAPYQQAIVRDLLFHLPAKCDSLLDVGCGNGKLTNIIAEAMAGRRVEGIDPSSTALQSLNCPARQGALPDLPYSDGAFQTLVTIDTAEHLPSAIYARSLHELQRIAQERIVLCVPLLERFEANHTLCGACGHLYHVNHHWRRYRLADFDGLFAEFEPELILFTGQVREHRAILDRALRSVFGLVNQWDKAVCPYCGEAASRNIAEATYAPVVTSLRNRAPLQSLRYYPNRSECMVFYRRRAEASPQATEAAAHCQAITRDGALLAKPDAVDVTEEATRYRYPAEQPIAYLEQVVAGRRYRLSVEASDDGWTAVPDWFLNLPIAVENPDWWDGLLQQAALRAVAAAAGRSEEQLEPRRRGLIARAARGDAP